MSRSITDARQVTLRQFLQQIANATTYAGTADAKPANQSELDNLLVAVNDELTQLLRMSASATPDLAVTIGSGILVNSENSRTRSIPHVGALLPAFTSGTVTFPASSGGTITVSPGNNGVLTVSSGNYIKVLIYLDSSGNLNVLSGVENITEASATVPKAPIDTLPLGYITLQNSLGTIQNISQGKIYQFDVGAGVTSTGLDSEFVIKDVTDGTKQIGFDAAGTTGTKTTIASSQTANRTVSLPDITDTLVSRTNAETLSNKQVAYSSSNDPAVTGANATVSSFSTGIIRLTNVSLVSLSGIPAGLSGQFVIVENKTGAQIFINNEEATATAADRILTGTNGNVSMPNNATFVFTYDSTSARWQLTGGSGSGSGSGDGIKNFIVNGNADNASASIFTGYSDGGTRPTDGTGGISTGITTGVEVVGAIDGLKSYYIQKTTTANQQGFGQSIPFSIPKAYRADLLKISFDYILESGTFQAGTNALDSDLIVYIYDVTNSKLIEPSDIKLRSNSTSICDKYEATFQTSFDGSDYRLIFHQATTTTTVYKLIVDNIAISPQNLNYVGVALDNILLYQNSGNVNNTGGVDSLVSLPNIVSNSGAYSITSGGVVVQKTGKYKIRIKTEIGANSEAIVLKIDINGTKTSGRSHSIDVNASGSQSLLEDSFYVDLIPGDLVRFYVLNPNTRPYQSSELELTQLTSPSVARISDGYDGRVVTMSAYKSAGQAVTANVTNLSFTTAEDTVSGWSSDTYQVKTSGHYDIFMRGSSSVGLLIYVYVNGVQTSYLTNLNNIQVLSGSTQLKLNVGDIVNIRSNTTATITGSAGSLNSETNLIITKVQGPQTISASETVALRYISTSGSVIQATPTTFLYGTKDYSTRGGYDPTTGEFRPPLPGQYKIKASIYGNYSAAINDLQISFYVNGVLKSFNVKTTPNGSAQQVEHVDTLELITTDVLTIRVHYAAPSVTFASSTAVGANVLTIERIK